MNSFFEYLLINDGLSPIEKTPTDSSPLISVEIVAVIVGGLMTLIGSAITNWWGRRPILEIKYKDGYILLSNTGSRPMRNVTVKDDVKENLKCDDIILPGETIKIDNNYSRVFSIKWKDGIIASGMISKNNADSTVIFLTNLLNSRSGFIPSDSISLDSLPTEMSELGKLAWSENVDVDLQSLSSSTSMIKISNKKLTPYPITITVSSDILTIRRIVCRVLNLKYCPIDYFELNAKCLNFYFMKSRWMEAVKEVNSQDLYGFSTKELYEILTKSNKQTALDYSKSHLETGTGINHDWNNPNYSLRTGRYGAIKAEDSFGIVLFDSKSAIESVLSKKPYSQGYIAIILFDGRVCWIGSGTPGISELAVTNLKLSDVEQIKREIEYFDRINKSRNRNDLRFLNFKKVK